MTYPGIKRAEYEERDRNVAAILQYLLRNPDRTHTEMSYDLAARVGASRINSARDWAKRHGLLEGDGAPMRYRLTEAGKLRAAEKARAA